MLGKYWVPSREKLINDIYDGFLNGAMERGYDIVIDNMNLDEKYIEDIQEDIDWFNANTHHDKEVNWRYEMEVKDFFHIPLQVCIDRDAQRENPIGEKVIKRTYYKYRDKISAWKYLR